MRLGFALGRLGLLACGGGSSVTFLRWTIQGYQPWLFFLYQSLSPFIPVHCMLQPGSNLPRW
jgi:hypothetical protein